MKNKVLLLLLSILIFLLPGKAQQYKANWSQLKKFERVIKDFDNSTTIHPEFINDTDMFWYHLRTSKGHAYYFVDPGRKIHRDLFNLESVFAQVSALTHEAYNQTNTSIENIEFDKELKSIKFSVEGDYYKYTIRTGKVTKAEPERDNYDDVPSGYMISPDSLYYIYACKHNLYCVGNKAKGMDTTVIQLTTDGTPANSYYQFPKAYTSEISYPSGHWLENSKTFLVETEDKSKTQKMYLVDMMNEPRPQLKEYNYSCPGDTAIAQYYFKFIDIETKKITEFHGEKWKDQFISLAYDDTKNGSEIYFFRTRRTWDEKELCAYDINTGKVRVLFNEVDKPYFDYVIAQTEFINQGKEVLFRSERTGFGHFYLYDTKTGRLKRAVTEGNYQTGQILEIRSKSRDIYFYAYGREKDVDPYYCMAYRANLDKPGITLLTPENANHTIYVSPSSKYIIDICSRVDMPCKGVVRNKNGKEIMKLENVDLEPLLKGGWRFPERFVVKAADGYTDLYGVMFKPMDFDSTRKYPIISDVYPGPQFEYVPVSFCLTSSMATELAQLGFIVIQVGHRGGTPIRGKAYQRYGYKNLRDYALADDIAVIKELGRRYSFVDATNAGIYGHSGGGFMTAAALCSSDFYKAGVASAGNHDNRLFNTGWIEMFNGVREKVIKNKNNPSDSIKFQPLKIQTNIEIADKCRGHLLLAVGLMDGNVHPAQTFRMARALMDAGINFDMVSLPCSTHAFQETENDYFSFKLRNHFAKYLLGDYSGENMLNYLEEIK